MTIGSPCRFDDILPSRFPNDSVSSKDCVRMFAHPCNGIERSRGNTSLYDPIELKVSDITIAIGPEGGFTDEEVSKAREANWQQLDLGSRILRVETAVCVSSIYASLRLA